MAAGEIPTNIFIGRNAHTDERHVRYVLCLNVSNSALNNAHVPLTDRIVGIADAIKKASTPIDAVVLLDVGGKTKGWTALALQFEEATGLHYAGTHYTSALESSYGKAVFIRRTTLAFHHIEQRWVSYSRGIWEGDCTGEDYLEIAFHPVVQEHVAFSNDEEPTLLTRVIRDLTIDVGFVRFYAQRASRHQSIQWINVASSCDVLMGDFKTDVCDTDTFSLFTKADYVHRDLQCTHTFKAFPNCTSRASPAMRAKLNLASEIVEEHEDGSATVRTAVTVDHIFHLAGCADILGPNCYALPTNDFSEHSAIVAELVFAK